mmetsp:Transcript_20361/g.60544  ORF Transcript_20361/g.60544 Transcript_20361/m.60544 type:complete len:86 (-) Transcript_20361:27-284(-)
MRKRNSHVGNALPQKDRRPGLDVPSMQQATADQRCMPYLLGVHSHLQVRQLGIMVSKFSDAGGLTPGFRTGPFRLALRSIRGILL